MSNSRLLAAAVSVAGSIRHLDRPEMVMILQADRDRIDRLNRSC